MVFVTGATGFLGSYLVKNLLKRGEQVRALKRKNSRFELLGNNKDKIEWVEGNLLDVNSLEDAIDGVDKVYHCAAIVLDAASNGDSALATNATGTANLFNVAMDKKVKKVLHVSSTATLGTSLTNQLIDENFYVPDEQLRFDYFKGKRYAELEAWRASAEGLPVVIVNPCGLIGAGWWSHEPSKLFQTIDEGLSFYTTGSNSFVDVRDVAEVMVQLMESKASGERFILVSENIALRDFLNMIADELQRKRPAHAVNAFISELAWRYEYVRAKLRGKPAEYTKEDLRIAQLSVKHSNLKVIEATGFKFRKLAESVHDTAVAYRASKQKGLEYAVFD